ncbi:MAG: ABC transporter ATP-binding protein [Nitrospirota bacterium]
MAAEELVAEFEKRYDGGPAVAVSFRLPVGRPSVLVLFGPSGTGKTTVLRCLAGLERITAGSIRFAGEIWAQAESGLLVRPQARSVGYLHQDYALFPHLTVAGNTAYALSRLSHEQRAARVRDMVRLCKLDGLEDRYPSQLSGGQQQRVGLARVLASRPRLLLLDEPLSALDLPTREQMRSELRGLIMGQDVPAIWVTHDWAEALTLADQVAVMGVGKILQVGPPEEVFSRPVNAEVAAIVGVETVLPATVVERRDDLAALVVGEVRLWAVEPQGQGDSFYLCIRAEDVTLERGARPDSSARNHLVGRVAEVRAAGPVSRVVVDCGVLLSALVTRQAAQELALGPGAPVTATIKASAIHLVPR